MAAGGDGTIGLNAVLPSSCARYHAIAGDTYVRTRKASCPSPFDRRNPMRSVGERDTGRLRRTWAVVGRCLLTMT